MCFTHLLQRCVVARVDIHHSGVRPSAVEPLTLRSAGVRNADLDPPDGLSLSRDSHQSSVLLVDRDVMLLCMVDGWASVRNDVQVRHKLH